MIRWLLLALLVASSTVSAIVIRDDVDDAAYRIPASELPALADMPGEGHGVLVAPQWVLTAATGHDTSGPNRTQLRRAFNTVDSAYDRWFCVVFDKPESALPCAVAYLLVAVALTCIHVEALALVLCNDGVDILSMRGPGLSFEGLIFAPRPARS